MEPQFGISIKAHRTGAVIITTTVEGLKGLRDNTSRSYSQYFAEAVERLEAPVPSEVVADQPPLPGL